ncbi:MAG: hypothetical protein ABEL76_10650 [Bradymonadaceae bacterium]
MRTGHRQFARALPGLLCAGLLLLGACDRDRPEPSADPSERLERNSRRAAKREKTHETRIRSSRRLGYLDQTVRTPVGERTVGIRCSTCHDSMVDGPPATRPEEVGSFHADMTLEHGDLSCNSCHSMEDRDRLSLADSTQISFDRTMELCGQCHGPQLRDYRHGAHGGMSGHWDLSRGSRTRNHCVNCHDPHDPAYPTVEPAPPPRDRFLNRPPGSNTSDSHGETHD